jgi:hypothetical protein
MVWIPGGTFLMGSDPRREWRKRSTRRPAIWGFAASFAADSMNVAPNAML